MNGGIAFFVGLLCSVAAPADDFHAVVSAVVRSGSVSEGGFVAAFAEDGADNAVAACSCNTVAEPAYRRADCAAFLTVWTILVVVVCTFIALFVCFQPFDYFAAVFCYGIAAKREYSAVFPLYFPVTARAVACFAVGRTVCACSFTVICLVASFKTLQYFAVAAFAEFCLAVG